MKPTRSLASLLVLAAAVLALTGCPKRPMTTAAQAPAPAPVAPAPAPAPLRRPLRLPRRRPRPSRLRHRRPPRRRRPRRASTPRTPRSRTSHSTSIARTSPAAARVLDASAAWLTANPRQIVLVEGHCDERGSNEYNLALGERRSRAAVAYLVSKGVDQSRFTLISYGEERPQCTEKTEACWARNRRAHFLVKER